MNSSRLVALALAVTLALGVVGICVLAAMTVPVPGILETVVTASLAGLVGLVAPSPREEKAIRPDVHAEYPQYETKN